MMLSEVFGGDLPSQTSCFSGVGLVRARGSLAGEGGGEGDDDHDEDDKEQTEPPFVVTRFATEHHMAELALHHRLRRRRRPPPPPPSPPPPTTTTTSQRQPPIEASPFYRLSTRQLLPRPPYPQSSLLFFPGDVGDVSVKEEPGAVRENTHAAPTCVAHSFLPLHDGTLDGGHVEAFALWNADATTSAAASASKKPNAKGTEHSSKKNSSSDAAPPSSPSSLHAFSTTETKLSVPKAILLLRSCQPSTKTNKETKKNVWAKAHVPLDYYPLKISLCRVHIQDASKGQQPSTPYVAIYTASADDNRIRLYLSNVLQQAGDAVSLLLQEVQLQIQQDAGNPAPTAAEAATEDQAEEKRSNDEEFPMGSLPKEETASANPFVLQSPIMALDTLEPLGPATTLKSARAAATTAAHLLGAGCQDGTIRFFAYRLVSLPAPADLPLSLVMSVMETASFVVDGPIISLHMMRKIRFPHTSTSGGGDMGAHSVQVLVGSMGGFACMFHHEDATGTRFFSAGPEIVLMTEDAVLAVRWLCPFGASESGTAILVGTQSGRLLLLEQKRVDQKSANEKLDNTTTSSVPNKSEDDAPSLSSVNNATTAPQWRLLWQQKLPYPIHGISCCQDICQDKLQKVIVTTRKSVHVFSSNAAAVADATKVRLERLGQRRPTTNTAVVA